MDVNDFDFGNIVMHIATLCLGMIALYHDVEYILLIRKHVVNCRKKWIAWKILTQIGNDASNAQRQK